MIYLYYGENVFDRDRELNVLIKDYAMQNGDTAVEHFPVDDADVNSAIDSVTTFPFLSSRRLVIVRYLSSNKELVSSIDKILDRVADTTDLLFVESEIDSRSVYSKTLKKRADTIKHFDTTHGVQLDELIYNRARECGCELKRSDASYLVERLGGNQNLLITELEKLSLLGAPIDKKIIDEMTERSPKSSVFEMLDALTAGDVSRALSLYEEQRQQGSPPQVIISMISWQLHVISQIVVSMNLSSDKISATTKLSPFLTRKNLPVARKLTKLKLIELYDAVLRADENIKKGKTKPEEQVRVLLVSLSQILKF